MMMVIMIIVIVPRDQAHKGSEPTDVKMSPLWYEKKIGPGSNNEGSRGDGGLVEDEEVVVVLVVAAVVVRNAATFLFSF